MSFQSAWARIVFVSLILCKVQSFLCSAYCKPNSCTGINSNQCTDCDSPFLLQTGGTCQIDPASGYALVYESVDISISQNGQVSCGAYTFKGQFSFNDLISLRTFNPIPIPHYTLRLIAWIIVYDEWDAVNDYFFGTINTTNERKNQSLNTYSTSEPLCSSGINERYVKLDLQFAHTDTTGNVRVVVSTTDVQQKPWGMKQYMYLAARCHLACLSCQDATTNNCSSCTAAYKLSGTVCSSNCLYRYGVTSTNVCVACSLYCTSCAQTATNCFSCQTNGTYQSFLNATSCVTNCPTRFTQSTANHTCIPCNDAFCDICTRDLSTRCQQCQAGYFWFNFACYSNCPNNYYNNAPNCTLCDVSCEVCTGSPSPCTACALNYFLYSAQCLSTCPVGFFPHRSLRQCLDCAVHCVTATISMALSSDNSKLIATLTFARSIDFSTFPISNFEIFTANDSSLSIANKFKVEYVPSTANSYDIILTPKPTINMSSTNFTISISPKTQDLFSSDGYLFSDSVYTLATWTLWTLIVYPELEDQEKAVVQQLEKVNDIINQGLGGKIVQEIKKTGLFALLFPGAQLCSTVVLHNSIPAQNFYEAARFWASFIYFEVPRWEEGPSLTKYVVSEPVQSLVSSSGRLLLTRNLQTAVVEENWRFTRTGHSSYFIFDTYLVLGLLVLSWLVIAGVRLFHSRMTSQKRSIFYTVLHRVHEFGLFYISLSVALEWLTFSKKLSDSDQNSNFVYAYASFGVSIFAVLYYLAYEMYVYYRIIPFGSTEAGSKKYLDFIEKYSFFLRDLRFEEYSASLAWTPRHMLRPYNYQILSCIRLILLVVALPIFHEYPYASLSCMMIVQFFEVLRLVLTWPYHSRWRNVFKLSLELTLLAIFCAYMFTYAMLQHIYENLNTVSESTMRSYYIAGWIGMFFVFAYNVMFIIYQTIDVVVGCKFSNLERVQNSRQQYYYQMLSQYQFKYANKPTKKKLKQNRQYGVIAKQYKNQSKIMDQIMLQQKSKLQAKFNKNLSIETQKINNEYEQKLRDYRQNKKGVFIGLIEGIHDAQFKDDDVKLDDSSRKKAIQNIIKKGNLNNQTYGDFKTTRVAIEEFQISYTEKERKYEVKAFKVPGVFMKPKIDPHSKDNLLIPQKDSKVIHLHPGLSREYYNMISKLFKSYASVSTEWVTLRTLLTVDQNRYSPGQQIPQVRQNLTQQIEVIEFNGSQQKETLPQVLNDFPVPYELFRNL